MSEINNNFFQKLNHLIESKQYKRLRFEVEMNGNVESQHLLVIFFYASSFYLDEESSNEQLLYCSSLFEKVYLFDKKKLQPLYNIIAVSFKTKIFARALPLALEAYEKNPNDLKLIEGLARINGFLGNRNKSNYFFKKLYELDPLKPGRMALVSSLNYTDNITQEDYMEECLKFSSIVEKKLCVEKEVFNFNYKKNTRIKIAFLSGDFKGHSVSNFLYDLFKNINKEKFELILISNLNEIEKDKVSLKLNSFADKWFDVFNYSDLQLVQFIRSVNIDILIDLSGFTEGNRFEVVARRCAKIQISWLGYNNSLGIKNLDYLISDRNLIKNEELGLYSEKILFMPKIWNSLTLPDKLPEINDDLRLNNSNFVFCSFNNFQKLTDHTVSVWSRILKNTNSQIYLKDSSKGGKDLQQNIIGKFLGFGAKQKQLKFFNHKENFYDHLSLYNQANAALDTFPYPGVTTSFEAILMGLPVLTMKGFNFNSRCGESINKNIQMDHLIAQNDNDYIEKAISLVNDNNLNTKYGINLRKKALISPLFDTNQFTKDFESLLIKINENNKPL